MRDISGDKGNDVAPVARIGPRWAAHARPHLIHGVDQPVRPVLLSVPHAGRDYPDIVLKRARGGLPVLQMLEDRYADLLLSRAIMSGHQAIVAHTPRAVIDLNRHPAEIDGSSVDGIPAGTAMRRSPKLRGGLGLIPARHHMMGDLWLSRPSFADVMERISGIHMPYHADISARLVQSRTMFGTAILIDVHSMPSIGARSGQPSPDVVIGDRHGESAGPAIVRAVLDLVHSHGFSVAHNHPYSGGYTLERHGRPAHGIHAVQIEIDRALYLDAAGQPGGSRQDACERLIADLSDTLSRHGARPDILAAE